MTHDISFLLRFIHKDPNQADDEIYFDDEQEAREALRDHDGDETSAELYDSIQLIKVDWTYRSDCMIDGIAFWDMCEGRG